MKAKQARSAAMIVDERTIVDLNLRSMAIVARGKELIMYGNEGNWADAGLMTLQTDGVRFHPFFLT